MEIVYIGHSSFRIKGKKATLVTDPYDPKSTGFKYPSGITADIVTISHGHDDHNNHSAVGGNPKVVNGPGEYEIKGVSIIGYDTYHDAKKGEERGKNTMYLIEIDEMRVLHSGDLGHKLTDSLVGEIGNVDVLLIPVGGVYTINSTEAGEMVKAIEPKITIPMHFKTPRHNPKVFTDLTTEEPFLADVGQVVEQESKLKVSSALPDEEQKVVVLAPKAF